VTSLPFEASHALGVFDRLLYGIDGGVGINDYALRNHVFLLADPHNVQSPLAYSQTIHVTYGPISRPNVCGERLAICFAPSVNRRSYVLTAGDCDPFRRFRVLYRVSVFHPLCLLAEGFGISLPARFSSSILPRQRICHLDRR